ncbi:MAG TPA: 23S ribosomal RNA methyltransferase Erm [Desulfitobacterium dehalogenans]|uniref:rRNA adenine N-6-methyltransferase n=1 Tax=Desulfitobacterium dehalogenans TaxID=36854 RepID=A0A7C6Z2X1_9FIRM|nr:23S ribosomal RNA methyltransferase Erm [Desulfitobacterium dehalogenans]
MSKNRSQGQTLPLWVSQNYLTRYKTIKSLLSRTTIGANDHVIEIGPGKGHITGLLVESCRKVTAIEIDEKLYDRLHQKFNDSANLHLYHQDFLKWRLPASGDYKVFANIPFCHTTAILRKLTESRNPPAEAWLTMEKGAAMRFMGKPHETLRSLMIKPVFDLKIVYYFLREDFHPKPGVDVVLLHLKKKTQPDISPAQWRNYEHFITSALQGNRAGLERMFTKRQLSRVFREADISDFVSGEILYVQWLCLFRSYCKHVLCSKQ